MSSIRETLSLWTFAIVLNCSAALLEEERTAPAIPAVGSHELRILSPTVLELSYVSTKQANAAVSDWNFVGANFAAQLPLPAQFVVTVDGVPAVVSQVGFKRRPISAPLRPRDLRIGNWLYLQLATPVEEGQEVIVKNPASEIWSDTLRNFSSRATATRFNPALHVSQLGYATSASKLGMVGYYLGSLGELEIAATAFQIVEAKRGNVVFTGNLRQRRDVGYAYTPTPYQKVYEADFSALTVPGDYRLMVPGMGVSYSFWINDSIPAALTRTYSLGMYHQRCGTSNSLPHTRHEHGLCHAAPAEVPTMSHTAVNRVLAEVSGDFSNNPRHTAPQLKDVQSSLYPFINQGPIDVSGGHHDAGDYSKYTINSAGLIHHLVYAADSFPGAGSLDNLGIPESGDGRSDLLQEAKWEADFLAKMQDADGGFYFLVYPRDRRYEDNVLPSPGDPQVVFPKNTAVTAAAVAALAEIASSPRFKEAFPLESANYLAKAKLGWEFLMRAIAAHGKDGAYQKMTHYGNEFMHDDELAWAAAALFVATGQDEYHAKLKDWYDPSDPKTRRWSWWRLFESYGNAARSYAFAARSGRLPNVLLDAAYLAKCEAEIRAAGDDIARFAEQTAYGTSFPDPNKRFRNAGWYFSSERAFEMAAAFQLDASPRYLAAIQSNLAYETGCNPINMPYITGVGWRRWHDIVHQYAMNDNRPLPPSGIVLGNVQGGFIYLENYKQELGALCFPPDGAAANPYPFYDRWGDSFNTTTEFVVVDQARAIATAAMLQGQVGDFAAPSQNIFGTIEGLPKFYPALERITVALSAPGVELSEARIVWEAADQAPRAGPVFTFTPKEVGEVWVEAEAMLPDGRRVFARGNVTITFPINSPPNSFQSAPVAPAPGLAAVFHLDGPTEGLALAGRTTFDSSNVGWMRDRSGAALRFFDLGDRATISIPASRLYTNGSTTEISLEAMIYVHAYKGWNRGLAKIVSLERGWNASLQLREDTYNGAHVRGGSQFDFWGPALTAAMPVRQWHHLSISISTKGYSARVNGVPVAAAASTELVNWSNGTAVLELGNFDGWIDELAIYSRAEKRPEAPSNVAATNILSTSLTISWSDLPNEAGYRIFRSTNAVDFVECANLAANTTNFRDNALVPNTAYIYSVRAHNLGGESPAATLATRTLSRTGIQALPRNKSRGGGWKGDIGKEGSLIIADSQNLPSYLTLAFSNRTDFVWAQSSTSSRSLQRAANDSRVLACIYSPTDFAVRVNINDGEPHIVSFYCIDPGDTGRSQRVEVYSSDTGELLHSEEARAFADGEYLSYRAEGRLIFRFVRTGTWNAVISGIFFDSVPTPAGASFAGQDTLTRGNWKGSYGAWGWNIPQDSASQRGAAKLSADGTSWVWSPTTADARALVRAESNNRFFGCLYTATEQVVRVEAPPGETMQVSFYCVDPFNEGRAQRIEAFDIISGEIFDVRSLTSFSAGVYLKYHVTGSVAFRFVNTGRFAAVISGIFLDPVPEPAVAAYLGEDTTTRGNWKGKYGAAGWALPEDVTQAPSGGVLLSTAGALTWKWIENSTDSRAPLRANSNSRFLSCYYTVDDFPISVTVPAGESRTVSFYCLDPFNEGRAQRVEVIDPTSGSVLHSRELTNFTGGVYLRYSVAGNVIFRFTKTGSLVPVVSGVFVDP